MAVTIERNAQDSYGNLISNIWLGRFKSSPPVIAVLGFAAWSIMLVIVASAYIVLTNKVQESATRATKREESEKAVLTENEAAQKWSREHK